MTRGRAALGLLLVAAYGLPLYVPPAPQWPPVPPGDAGLLARIFAGVPAWWVGGRLVCLLGGAVLLAAAVRPARGVLAPVERADEERFPPGRHPLFAWAALLVAALLLALAPAAARFGSGGATAYLVATLLPALLLWAADGRAPRGGWLAGARRLGPLLILPVLWTAWCLATAWRSPLAASVTDGWLMLERFEGVRDGTLRALAFNTEAGFGNAYTLLEGVAFLDPGRTDLAFAWLQWVHVVWAALAAVALGVLARVVLVRRDAAVVAQAGYLFSPFALSVPHDMLPLFLGPLCVSLLVLLFLVVRARGSRAALVALGPVAAFAGAIPLITAVALLVCLLLVRVLWSWRRIPWLTVGTSALAGLAVLVPGLPSREALGETANRFTGGAGSTTRVVDVLFGQESPSAIAKALEEGAAGRFDLVMEALLAPFAIVRTPHRLWGDALLEPLGAALVAVGLLLCVAWRRRNANALLVPALVAASFVGALTSSGDHVSHSRLAPALVPFALLMAVAFEALRSAWWARTAWGPAALTAGAMALGGALLFERVTPAVLPAAWTQVAFEALLADPGRAQVVLLLHGRPEEPSFLQVGRMAAHLPREPQPTMNMLELDAALQRPDAEPPRAYLWSPALERDDAVSVKLCTRWPGATLFVLRDRARLFHALAAAPSGAWSPPLPPERWAAWRCGEPPPRDVAARRATPGDPERPIASAADLVAVLSLDAAQYAALVAEVNGMKDRVVAILARPRPGRPSMLDDLLAAMRDGQAALAAFVPRLGQERPPNSERTYAQRIRVEEERLRSRLDAILTPAQAEALAGRSVNWLWLETGHNPFLLRFTRSAGAPDAP